jgi:molybdopterin adenylyltransferase
MLKQHRKISPKKVNCAIITVSDTRNKDTDKSGKLIHDLLGSEDHEVGYYAIVPDEKKDIVQSIQQAIDDDKIEAIIINGGTGVANRDVTIEAVTPLFDKELPGFGEIFRYLSYEQDIGSASILSRAVAGIANNTVVFSIPGSSGAVRLAMTELILKELGHIVMEINKDLTK